jgi:hypothetical protein
MWAFPPAIWILISVVYGTSHGALGYDPEADPEIAGKPLRWLLYSAAALAGWTLLAVLLAPVIIRINEGWWDLRKARIESVRLAVGTAQLAALLLAIAGAYWLAVAVLGGWPGGWRDAAVGALIGALAGTALGVPTNLVAARFRIADWLGDETPPETSR